MGKLVANLADAEEERLMAGTLLEKHLDHDQDFRQ
jgi:hypothetical protein